jgi:restriction system protein
LCDFRICVLLAENSVGNAGALVNTIDVKHDGLGKFRRISGSAVEVRGAALARQWDDQWSKRRDIERNADAALLKALKKTQADDASEEARRAVSSVTSILLNTLRGPKLAEPERHAFVEAPPVEPVPPVLAAEPRKSAFRPQTPLTLAVLLNPRGLRRRRDGARQAYKNAYEQWNSAVRWKTQEHDKAQQDFRTAYAHWEARRTAHAALQSRAAARRQELSRSYVQRDGEAVLGRCDWALMAVDRPENFPKFWTAAMTSSLGVVSVDYDLPSLEQMPAVKSVRYAQDGFETVVLNETEREQLYAEAVFQTCLAALHVLFESDEADAIRSVTFNGWSNMIDRANGRPVRACILSVTAMKQSFAKIDLKSVDPKACFKALNGAMSPKLAAMG